MTSVIVPPVDLAPGMPSRVVAISATDVTEGGTSLAGQMVRFALSDSLDVTSGGDVIAKSQAEVVLDSQGNGSIRLPVYNDAVKTWCGDPDWAIIVTTTWGSQKAIRIPAGTTPIALSALPPVRPLRGREKQWAVTGVSLTVTAGTEAGQASGSASLHGGILDIDLSIPPAGPHTHSELTVQAGYKARLDSNGIFQILNPDGSIGFRYSMTAGYLSAGNIPWGRLTGVPATFPPAAHTHEETTPGAYGPLGPLRALLPNAATHDVPIFFVGSSTTAGNYPKYLTESLAANYPSGGAEPGLIRATTPITPHTGPGVVGYNGGIPGTHSGTYLPTAVLDNIAATQPVAIVHGIGSNDWAGSIDPAVFEANLRAGIAEIDSRVTTPHVHIIFQQHTRIGTRTHPWSAYTDAMRRVVKDGTDRVFLDLGPVLDAVDPLATDPFGLGNGDGVHLGLGGSRFLADVMASALGLPTTTRIPGGEDPAYDSGVITVTSLLNGWTGSITYVRAGDLVEVAVSNLDGSAATSGTAYTLPPGYRPRTLKRSEVTTPYASDGQRNPARLTIDPSGAVILYSHNDLSGSGYYGDLPVYTTTDPLPTP